MYEFIINNVYMYFIYMYMYKKSHRKSLFIALDSFI